MFQQKSACIPTLYLFALGSLVTFDIRLSFGDEKVTGAIQVDGKPLATGKITFRGNDGKTTEDPVKDGKFSSTVKAPGDFKITIVAGEAEAEKPAGDLAALQGEWKAWQNEEDYLLFAIKGHSFTITSFVKGNALTPWTGTLAIDDTITPKHLTWLAVKSAGKDLPGNRCIYELHGDTWLLIGGGAEKRPERFYSGLGDGHRQTMIFQREKAVKK